ncbi:MAG TPA: hypothetical protein VMV59_08570, partial [Candidatus Dormibacteraeota bacterium]|nr:hypothetical protein [Candidatus Dormibacteraeota bacterium]
PSVTDSEVNRIFSSARVKTFSFGYLAGKLVAQAPDTAGNTNKNRSMRPWLCQRLARKRVIRRSNGIKCAVSQISADFEFGQYFPEMGRNATNCNFLDR